jgi:uncharacterized protein
MQEMWAPGSLILLTPLVAVIAGAYASVGLGGGTGYLAVMTLVGMPATTMTSTALVLNLVVTGAALLRFGLAGRLNWHLFLPFLIPAMPAAFLGGLVTANRKVFFFLLSSALAIAGLAMFRSQPSTQDTQKRPNQFRLLSIAIPSGFTIGALSGFLGIGGGVFLGPLIMFLRWAGPREIVAMNAALVLTLSAIALAAHEIKGTVQLSVALPLAVAAVVGGLAGAWLAEKKMSAHTLQRVFAVIIIIAAAKAAHDALQ